MRISIKIALVTIVALLLFGFAAFKLSEVRHLKGFLPPAYGRVVLEDRTSLVAGFGPGGHDAVLAFFRLSDDVASLISQGGVAWLEEAERSIELRRSRQIGEWISTPLSGENFAWANELNCAANVSDWWLTSHSDHSCPGIAAYLRGYGFLDKLEASKTAAVDAILQSEGAFISKRRVGYLIVAPERRLVVFAHAG